MTFDRYDTSELQIRLYDQMAIATGRLDVLASWQGFSKETRRSSKATKVGDWLGGRDSNPDNVVQSHVSYR